MKPRPWPLIALLLLSTADAAAAARDFVAREIHIPNAEPFVLADPVRIAPGEIALRQIEPGDPDAALWSARSRWLRYRDDGTLLGVIGELPGRLRTLASGSQWLSSRVIVPTETALDAACVFGRIDVTRTNPLRWSHVVHASDCD